MTIRLDEIGYWSEIKLDIVRKYAAAYSAIMTKQDWIRGYYYIDAFAGAGIHLSKRTNEFVLGSPLNALNVKPPFNGYHFIDLKDEKVDLLRELTVDCENVTAMPYFSARYSRPFVMIPTNVHFVCLTRTVCIWTGKLCTQQGNHGPLRSS